MIYICVPTHNEQQTVGVVLWKLRQVLTEFHRDYQILVADDASTDKTPEVLEPYTRVLPLTVIRSDRRLGHAASLELLLREAVRRSEYPKRDIIVTLQADFSEEPDDVVPMIKRIEAGADLVVGNKVSATRPARLRRLARRLGSFFTRGQQWPEGVTTPFDGYRAYRVHGVKRAVEESGGRRLMRYDGWAGNAELLRSVQPHARRVEVLDVEDRSDRLQRPRRERPIAAALRVRPMLRAEDPPGLITVEELERIAATAARSRVAAGPAAQSGGAGGAPGDERGNGRSHQRGGEGGRPRNGRERGASRTEARDGAAAKRAAQPTGRKPAREAAQPTAAKPAREAAQPAGTKPAPEAAQVAAGEPVAGPTRAKKRRRRRRRSASGGNVAPEQAVAAGSAAGEEPPGEAGAGAGDEAGERGGMVPGSTEAREPKRRRRRGGRGRRRGPRASSSETGAAADGVVGGEAAATDVAAGAPHSEPASTTAPAPPAVRDEE